MFKRKSPKVRVNSIKFHKEVGVNLTPIFVMELIFAIFYLDFFEILIWFGIWRLGWG